MGYLMRRNILAYKAPPNNEGYDLICIHPDRGMSRAMAKSLKLEFRSRVATRRIATEEVPLKEVSRTAFDFLRVVL